jgi:hypothetical protein
MFFWFMEFDQSFLPNPQPGPVSGFGMASATID